MGVLPLTKISAGRSFYLTMKKENADGLLLVFAGEEGGCCCFGNSIAQEYVQNKTRRGMAFLSVIDYAKYSFRE